jgi:hypothetical protein
VLQKQMKDLLRRTRSIACASLLACLVLGVFAAGAMAVEEPAPSINKPPDKTSTVGKAAAVIITGTDLAEITATGLPAGVPQPVEVKANEWKIEGTPTTAETTTVTLEAKNAEKKAGPPVNFKWTVNEPEAAPTITKPSDKASTVGGTAAVIVTGNNLATLTATGLPAGVPQPVEVKANEWKIEGTPTTAEVTTVTLEAKNKEGEPVSPVTTTFEWTVEEAPTIVKPPDQASTVGKAVTQVTITGTNLFLILPPEELPVGLTLSKVTEAEWTITGTPTTVQTTTVRLEAKNKAGGTSAPLTFKWTVTAAQEPPKIETPSKPPETPSKPPETPKAVSAGRLGTMPTQKQGRELWASFLCEVASCKVQVMATITAGKAKFKLHSVRTPIAQGKKTRIALKLTKKQRALIAAALKKRKKVTAAMSASIDSSVGRQVTKALVVTVKR